MFRILGLFCEFAAQTLVISSTDITGFTAKVSQREQHNNTQEDAPVALSGQRLVRVPIEALLPEHGS